ncbi:CIDEA protein, partial [Atractosteus spatula]|nr:CIDEA protein [Atractosteus spatula]
MVASSLDSLLAKAVQAFLLTSEVITLVLEEDGTVVENEEFFQSLETNTQFMLLEGGQRWTPAKGAPGLKRSKKNGIAKFSFDLYKLNPKDFIGCLTIKAIFYDTYTMSYDIKCTGAKQVLKIALRYLSYLARVAGQLLLYSASYVYQRIGEEEQTGTSGTL